MNKKKKNYILEVLFPEEFLGCMCSASFASLFQSHEVIFIRNFF